MKIKLNKINKMKKEFEIRGLWIYPKKVKVEGVRVPKKYKKEAEILFKLARKGGKGKEEIEDVIYKNLKKEISKRKLLKLKNRYFNLIKISDIKETLNEIDKLMEINKIKTNAEILKILIESAKFKNEQEVKKAVNKRLKYEEEDTKIIYRLKTMSLEYPLIATRIMRFKKMDIDVSLELAKGFELKHLSESLNLKIFLKKKYIDKLLENIEAVVKYLSRKKERIELEDIKINLKKRLLRNNRRLKKNKMLLIEKKEINKKEIKKLEEENEKIKKEIPRISEKIRENSWTYMAYNSIFGIFDAIMTYLVYEFVENESHLIYKDMDTEKGKSKK